MDDPRHVSDQLPEPYRGIVAELERNTGIEAVGEERLRCIIAVLVDRLGGEATIEQHEMNGLRPAHIYPQTNGDTKVSADKDFARCGS